MLPMMINAKECNDYRTISLMGDTLQAFLKVIPASVYRKHEQDSRGYAH